MLHGENYNRSLDKQRNKAVDNRSSNGPMWINMLAGLNGGYWVRQDHWPDSVAALSTGHGMQHNDNKQGHKADLAVICSSRLLVYPTTGNQEYVGRSLRGKFKSRWKIFIHYRTFCVWEQQYYARSCHIPELAGNVPTKKIPHKTKQVEQSMLGRARTYIWTEWIRWRMWNKLCWHGCRDYW